MPDDKHSIAVGLAAGGLAALIVAGCAGGGVGEQGAALTPAEATGLSSPPGTYVLSEEERELDCRRLTGRTQVRILQLRQLEIETDRSSVSLALQKATTTVVGGSTVGLDSDGERLQAMKQVEAYNARLGELGCKTFNLADELSPNSGSTIPRPVERTEPPSAVGAKTAKAAPPAATTPR